MFHLVYVSSAVVPFSMTELLELLARSRENNSRSGVTGMLLYKDGNFMQALEGEESTVRSVHARIERDPRHRGLITLLQEPLQQRRFPEWSMGLRELTAPDVIATPGYSQFMNTPLTGQEFSTEPALSQRLLLTFKKNR